jgi:hypothetical protein
MGKLYEENKRLRNYERMIEEINNGPSKRERIVAIILLLMVLVITVLCLTV